MNRPNQSIPYSQRRRYSNAAVTSGGSGATAQHRVVLQVNDRAMGSVTCQVETLPIISHTEVDITSAHTQSSRFSTVNSTDYAHGTVIRVTATPATTDYVLDHFEDADGNRLNTNTRLLRVTVTKDVTVRAVFRKANNTPTQYDVKVVWDKTRGSVTGSPALGTDGSTLANTGQVIRLTATPKEGYVLKEWNGTQVAGKWVPMHGLTIEQQIFSNRTINAVFEPKEVSPAENDKTTDPLDPDPANDPANTGTGGGSFTGDVVENLDLNGNTADFPSPNASAMYYIARFVKKWWWAILIAAYVIYKEKGGKK